MRQKVVFVDFETRSNYDLKKGGAYNYSLDASTQVLCMAYAFDDEDVRLWLPGEPLPDFTGCQIRAHNAAFERLVFWYVLEQDYPLEQFYCTAAQARANCLPGSLEDVGRAVSSSMRKDHRGNELVRKCCCPPFNTELLPELYEYCLQDVRAMRAISKSMRDLSAEELADYHVNERINDAGLLIDVELCKSAAQYAAQEVQDIEADIRGMTDGAITSVRSPRLREWVWNRVGEQARKLMITHKDGEEKRSLDKNARAALINFAEENPDEVPSLVADVVRSADDMFSSSVSKFTRMAELADEEDHRLRGAFIFAGGSATGRNSSTGAQLQNMSRMCAEDPEAVRRALVRGHEVVPKFGKRVTDVLKGMLRPSIMAPKGKVLISLDWSGIEARVTPWITGDPRAETTLDVFRQGKDIYISTAAAMFNKAEADVTKADRMLGKVAVLACGFGGSIGAFASMGRIYGVALPEAEAKRMVNLWRRSNPWAQPFWSALDEAARRAIRNPERQFAVGKVVYMKQGYHLWYSLPSGRVLCYPFVRFEDDGQISYLKAAWKPAQGDKEWPRARLWAGIQAENLVQATANCLLRHAMRQMDSEGMKIIGSVHDEIIVECNKDVAEKTKARMIEIMTCAPEWALGLPLDVEGDSMDRFSK